MIIKGFNLNLKKLVVILIFIATIAIWVYFKDRREIISSIYPINKIHVKILGEVKNPGIYELPQGSITKDLIDLSGGFTDKAAFENIQLDLELSDGQIVKIGTGR